MLTNAYQTTYGGSWDAFVVKFNTAGSALLYSTFLGGSSGLDTSHAIAVDGAGNAYVAGETRSNNFPTKNAYQGTNGGGTADAFVAGIDTTQSGAASLIYS